MRKLKLAFLSLAAIGFFSLVGCTKKYTTTTTGSDSVFTSPWITLAMTFNSVDSDFEQNITAPRVTAAILNDGVVLGYGAFLDQNNDTVVSSALEYDMFQTFSVGNIFLQAGADNTGLWYRYVTIPGHVLTTKGLTPIQARSLSYAAITKLLAPGAKTSSSPTVQ